MNAIPFDIQLILFPAIIAYLIGSIPFGLILTRAAGLGDIRQIGSGNICATNVLRTGNKKLALATLLLDFGKGYLAIIAANTIAGYVFAEWIVTASVVSGAEIGLRIQAFATAQSSAAIAVIIGHAYSLWLGFKGGKGVATLFGVAFALSLPVGLACAAAWLFVFAITRYSSLAALVMLGVFGIGLYIDWPLLWLPAVILPLLIAALHWANINRLLRGEELRFEFKKHD